MERKVKILNEYYDHVRRFYLAENNSQEQRWLIVRLWGLKKIASKVN